MTHLPFITVHRSRTLYRRLASRQQPTSIPQLHSTAGATPRHINPTPYLHVLYTPSRALLRLYTPLFSVRFDSNVPGTQPGTPTMPLSAGVQPAIAGEAPPRQSAASARCAAVELQKEEAVAGPAGRPAGRGPGVPGCAGLGRPAAEGRRARFMFRAYKKRGVASRRAPSERLKCGNASCDWFSVAETSPWRLGLLV